MNVKKFQIKGIHCTYYPADNSIGTAVICHGFASSQQSSSAIAFKQALHDIGLSVITFDFYGHGKSKGDFKQLTMSKCIDNTNDVINYIKHSFSVNKIVLLGYSYGGLIATVVAATRRDISALLLINPLSDYQEKERLLGRDSILSEWANTGTRSYTINEKQLMLAYDFFTDSQKYSSYTSLPDVKADVLLIHSEKDEMVPLYQSTKLSKLSGINLIILPNGDHRLRTIGSHQKVAELIRNFIKAHL